MNGHFEVEHIVPPALWLTYVAGQIPGLTPLAGRQGPQHLDNFAWSCAFCNNAKGRQITHPIGGRLVRLFDPRYDVWTDHFIFVHRYLFILGTTNIGRATVAALGLNDARLEGPLGPRHDAILAGLYPPPWARSWLID
jgi:hypothetical protein